jgi:hypothetical protein
MVRGFSVGGGRTARLWTICKGFRRVSHGTCPGAALRYLGKATAVNYRPQMRPPDLARA